MIIVELIEVALNKAEHTCNSYIVKSNNGSKESQVIQSNQDMHVYGIWWMGVYIWRWLILILLLLFKNKSLASTSNFLRKTWAISNFFSFSSSLFFLSLYIYFLGRRASKYLLFQLLGHMSIFLTPSIFSIHFSFAHDFLSWGRLGFRKCACSRENLKFQNMSGPNPLRWKVDNYTKCVSW